MWIHGRRGLTGTKPLPAQGASPGFENGQPRPARTSPRPRERLTTSPTRKDCPASRSPPGLVHCDRLASPHCTQDTRPASPGGKESHIQGTTCGPAGALSTPPENVGPLEAGWEEGALGEEVTEGKLPTRSASLPHVLCCHPPALTARLGLVDVCSPGKQTEAHLPTQRTRCPLA